MKYDLLPEKIKRFLFAAFRFSVPFLIFYLLRYNAGSECSPVYFRIYYWQCTFDFIFVLLGTAAGVFSVLLLQKNREFLYWLRAASLAALAIGVFNFGISRPVPVNWENAFVQTPMQLEKEKAKAKESAMPVLVFFHADWCESCDDFERYILGNPEIRPLLDGFYCVKADATDFETWHLFLLERFRIEGVPSVGLVSKKGEDSKTSFTGNHVPLSVVSDILKEALL